MVNPVDSTPKHLAWCSSGLVGTPPDESGSLGRPGRAATGKPQDGEPLVLSFGGFTNPPLPQIKLLVECNISAHVRIPRNVVYENTRQVIHRKGDGLVSIFRHHHQTAESDPKTVRRSNPKYARRSKCRDISVFTLRSGSPTSRVDSESFVIPSPVRDAWGTSVERSIGSSWVTQIFLQLGADVKTTREIPVNDMGIMKGRMKGQFASIAQQ